MAYDLAKFIGPGKHALDKNSELESVKQAVAKGMEELEISLNDDGFQVRVDSTGYGAKADLRLHLKDGKFSFGAGRNDDKAEKPWDSKNFKWAGVKEPKDVFEIGDALRVYLDVMEVLLAVLDSKDFTHQRTS